MFNREIPILSDKISESVTLPLEEYLDGIVTAVTLELPIASVAIMAVNAESMPPDNPSKTLSKPDFLT